MDDAKCRDVMNGPGSGDEHRKPQTNDVMSRGKVRAFLESHPVATWDMATFDRCCNPMEQAKAFAALRKSRGWTQSQLAREFGITQASVSRALSLLALPERIQELIGCGDLPVVTAVEIAKVRDPADQIKLAERVIAECLSSREVAAIIGAPRRGERRRRTVAGRSRAWRHPMGVEVTLTRFRKTVAPEIYLETVRAVVQLLEAEQRNQDVA
jgi:transcriptional regulator with XRE-family HTH domain